MSIGSFARLGGVSVKTLRFYAAEGLLEPAHVDADTGYRYYTESQTEALTQILSLRELGMSLPEIRRALGHAHADLAQALERHEAALRKSRFEVDRQLQALGVLRTVLREDWLGQHGPIRVVLSDPQFCLRIPIAPGDKISAAFDEAERRAAEAGARAPRAPFTRWVRKPPADPRIVDVCVPVEDARSGAFSSDDVDWVGARGVALSMIHLGPYSALEARAARLRENLTKSGPEITLESFEIYHRFSADQEGYELPSRVLAPSEDDFVTELQMPIAIPTQESPE